MASVWRDTLHWLVLALSVSATLIATWVTYEGGRTESVEYFDRLTNRKISEISAAGGEIEQMLRGAAGLFNVMGEPSSAQWAAYVAGLAHKEAPPSLIELGFAASAGDGSKRTVRVKLSAGLGAGLRDKTYTSAGDALEGRPELAAALARADAEGAPSLSRKMAAVPGRSGLGPGALLMLPVRADGKTNGGKASGGMAGGYVFAVVRLDDLAAQVARADAGYFRLRAYEGREQTAASMIFAPAPGENAPQFVKLASVLLGGQLWTLVFESTAALDGLLESRRPYWILAGGLAGSLMLFGLAWSLMRTRRQAAAIAEHMTRELSDQVKFSDDLVERNPNPMFRKDLDGRYVSFNRAWERLTGRNRNDWIGKRNEEVQSNERAGVYVNQDRELIANPERIDRQETKIIAHDGHAFDVIVSKAAVRRADGTVVGIIGTVTDFTESKKLATELAQQREQLELVNQSAQAGVWDHQLPDGPRYLSPRFYAMLGYPEDTDLGDMAERLDLVHPDDLEYVRAMRDSHFARTEPYFTAEYRLRRADGQYIWVSGRGVAIFDHGGTPVRFTGSIIDVSEQRRVQDEIAQQRELLDLVVESVQAGVFDYDLQTGSVYYSSRLRTILGFEADEDISAHARDPERIHADGREQVIAKRLAAVESGTTYDVECRLRCKDGNWIWVHSRANPTMGPDGKAVRFTGALMDISARKEAELALIEANTRALEAALAKSTFLATMSHEIRTPLNGVIGSAGLLIDTRLSHEQRDYVETIQLSGEQLLMLINDILDFSKIDSGKMELEDAPLEVAAMIEDAFDLVAGRARSKKLELLYEIDPAVPTFIAGDITRLRQVLINLAGNSIKFTEQGEVRVECRVVPDTSLVDGNPGSNLLAADGAKPDSAGTPQAGQAMLLEFAVHDTGIGIPADKIGRLFTAFTQVDASTTRKYGGTGLGLAISRRLIDLMGGTIRVESELGRGTSFIFTIRTRPAAGESKLKNLYHDGIQQVLLVDDYPPNLRILSAQCAAWGLTVVTAESALSALALIESAQKAGQPVTAVISDMSMPDMDGLDLAAAIAAHRERYGIKLPVIILSSSPRSEIYEGRTVPGDWIASYLLKPARQSQIYNALQDALSLHDPFDLSGIEAKAASPADPLAGVKLNLLLAEDNEVNRKIALRMLERLGYTADAVVDGAQAVDAVLAGAYDCVLMDVQMPELDGLEATRRIAAHMAPARRPYVIAVTANAMAGDRDKCLAAGMDDYLSKPIQMKTLAEAVGRAARFKQRREAGLETGGPASVVAAGAVAAARSTVLDMEQVGELIALDPELGVLAEFVGMYTAQAPARISAIKLALLDNNLTAVSHEAHTFKGASANLGAARVALVARQIELAGKAGDGSQIFGWLDDLEAAYAEAVQALKALVDKA